MKRLFIFSLIFILILNSSYALFNTDDFIYIKRNTTILNNTYNTYYNNLTPNSLECGLGDYLFNISIDSTGDLGGVCRADQDTTYSENSPYLTLVGTVFGFDRLTLGNVSGKGTANYIPKWLNEQNLTNSIMYENSSKIGIGTTSPVQSVEIKTGTGVPSILQTTWITNTQHGGINFYQSTASMSSIITRGSGYSDTNRRYDLELSTHQSNSGDIVFRTNSGGAEGNRIIIKNAGNVGINGITPQESLDVNGNIIAEGECIGDFSQTNVCGATNTQLFIGRNTGNYNIDVLGNGRFTTGVYSDYLYGNTHNANKIRLSESGVLSFYPNNEISVNMTSSTMSYPYNIVNDSSPNNYDGVAKNNLNNDIVGKIGNASRQGTATSQYIEVPTHPALGSSDGVTIMAWEKRNKIGVVQAVISQGLGSLNANFILGYRASNAVFCGFYSNDLDSISTYTDTTNWNLIACTYNKTTNRRIIYRNGVEIANALSTGDSTASGALYIGAFSYATSFSYNGSIDEVATYNRVLTQSEINASYVRGLAGLSNNITSGRQSYYKMDEYPYWQTGAILPSKIYLFRDSNFSQNIVIGRNLTVDTNTLFVNSENNRVGIGTLTPNSKLQINGNLTAGNSTGYTVFSNDGTMTMYGTARKYKEDAIFAVRTTKGVSAPSEVQFQIGINSNMLGEALSFSKISQQDAYFTYHVPEDIDNSENLTFHLMWKPDSAWTTGYYIWKLEYIVKGEDDNSTTDTSTIIYMNVTPTNTDNFIETEFTTGIDADGQETITCHFYRDTDNDNADAEGLTRFYEFERVVNKQGE